MSDDTVTVRVWEFSRFTDGYPTNEEDPEEYELPLEDVFSASLAEGEWLAEDIDNHSKYAFDVVDIPEDETVVLNVHADDSYHDTTPEEETPIERGLGFPHDSDYEPFKCEIWGAVWMWAELDD